MKVAIIGSTGVIGRRVAPLLVAAGHSVTAIARPNSSRQPVAAQFKVIEACLFDKRQLIAALAGHEAVINLATRIPSSPLTMMMRSGWRENDRIRSTGARNVSEAASAAALQTVIQESFGLAYRSSADRWV